MKLSSNNSYVSVTVFSMIALAMTWNALISPKIVQAQSQPQQEKASNDKSPLKEQSHAWGWIGRWMGWGDEREMSGKMGPGMGRGMGRGSGMGQGRPSMIRHRYFMRNGIPQNYRSKVSSSELSPEIVAEGAVLFADNCASCHGARGLGDGEAGRNLNPPPANIARMMGMPMYSDAYLFWTISEGGTPVGSAMPVFKDVLDEEEIWKVIAAARAGFPARKDKQ